MKRKTVSTLVLIVTVVIGFASAQRMPQNPLRRIPASRGSAAAQPATLGSSPVLVVDYPRQAGQQAPFAINDSGKIVGFYNLANGGANGYEFAGETFKDVIYPQAFATIAY